MEESYRKEPRVTLGLITYNQGDFVAEAVQAALNQTYHTLEVLICDDASDDNTFALARSSVMATPTCHGVRLRRNRHRLGIANFNQLISHATGELIIIAHGDDVSYPTRVERVVQEWISSGSSMITSNAHEIDADGNLVRDAYPCGAKPNNSLVGIATNGWNPTLWGAVLAIHREIFDIFGPLDPSQSAMTTDWILPFRAASIHGIKYIDEKLVKIRHHPNQKSNLLFSGHNEIEKLEKCSSVDLVQYLYMLDDLFRVVKPHQLQTPEVIEQTHQALLASILRTANFWRVFRNKLDASRLGLES
jgi:glycosyltransferase involved in cell wall biosynthesis